MKILFAVMAAVWVFGFWVGYFASLVVAASLVKGV